MMTKTLDFEGRWRLVVSSDGTHRIIYSGGHGDELELRPVRDGNTAWLRLGADMDTPHATEISIALDLADLDQLANALRWARAVMTTPARGEGGDE